MLDYIKALFETLPDYTGHFQPEINQDQWEQKCESIHRVTRRFVAYSAASYNQTRNKFLDRLKSAQSAMDGPWWAFGDAGGDWFSAEWKRMTEDLRQNDAKLVPIYQEMIGGNYVLPAIEEKYLEKIVEQLIALHIYYDSIVQTAPFVMTARLDHVLFVLSVHIFESLEDFKSKQIAADSHALSREKRTESKKEREELVIGWYRRNIDMNKFRGNLSKLASNIGSAVQQEYPRVFRNRPTRNTIIGYLESDPGIAGELEKLKYN